MSKPADCKTCVTFRCCPDHCCNWDGCTCGDCELCGGTLSFEYTKKELDDFEAEKQSEIQRKIDEEQRIELEKKKQEEARLEEEKRKIEEQRLLEAKAKEKESEEAQVNKIIARDEEYQKAMAMLNETQRKNQETLNSVNSSIAKIGDTLKTIRETTGAMDNFKNEWDKVLKKVTDNLASKIGPIHMRAPRPDEFDMTPEITDLDTITDEIAKMEHIVVLTGAGISVASNLPSFRGEGGFWTTRDKQEKVKASEFLTYTNFISYPEEIWHWHHELRKTVAMNNPNISHTCLADFQVFCEKSNRKFTMITQNIDGYHIEAYVKANKVIEQGSDKTFVTTSKDVEERKISDLPQKQANGLEVVGNSYSKADDYEEKKLSDIERPSSSDFNKKYSICKEVYEIHGDINYMRCANNCSNKFFPAPEIGCSPDFVPKCPNCSSIARPHTLFFDENYLEAFYRSNSLLDEIQTMDCLIVIGTALETNLAANIVAQAITNKKLIIEINIDPVIKYGNVKYLLGQAEQIVPNLCELILAKFQTN